MINTFKSYSLYLAWLVALVGTCLSLYWSNIQALPVCELCWYQRIALYPLAIILGIAAYRHFYGIVIYSLPLSLLGASVALYQYAIQMFPNLSAIGVCAQGISCRAIHMKYLGFITLPFLAFTGFIIISVLLWCAALYSQQDM